MDRKWIYLFLLILFSLEVSKIEGKRHGKRKKARVHVSDATVEVSGRCATTTLGSTSYSESITIPQRNWAETPFVYRDNSGQYRVSGRAVHMNYLKDQLEGKGESFRASRTDAPPELSIEMQADTVYIQGHVQLFGIRTLRMIARVIIGETGSVLDLSAPAWSEEIYRNPIPPGGNGQNGRDGLNGPTVEIIAYEMQGAFRIMTNGGDGLRGQNGGNGLNGVDNNNQEPNARDIDCQYQPKPECPDIPPRQGTVGNPGGDGGSSGRGGNGGHSGSLTVLVNRVEGNVELRSCGGSGASPGTNGRGGRGGLGSISGTGAGCRNWNPDYNCMQMKILKAPARRRGNSGSPGNTPNTRGRDGPLDTEAVQSRPLDEATMKTYPLSLLRFAKRNADRLLLANDLTTARKVLTFLKLFTANRQDAGDIYKEAKRRLGFSGKEGFDMFGNNELYAPRIEWEVLRTVVEDIRDYATDYENSFNIIRRSMETKQKFEQLAAQMSSVVETQIQTERDRLVEARRVAESEKALYVRAITHLEEKMVNIVKYIEREIPSAISASRFNIHDLLAIMQGSCGVAGSDAAAELLGPAIEVAIEMSDVLTCPSGTLDNIIGSLKKWLTFGIRYNPLEDSSDLDFDHVDIESIPEMMQANFEGNKESLTAELVCLMDVNPEEQEVAQLKQYIEQFFISGASRIDLIGKIIDLDNEIGGYNFDIPLLEETENLLAGAKQLTGSSDTEEVRNSLLEHLLGSYQELEGSFMKKVYELYKAFKFRTLWETDNPLPQFQRVASEGTGGQHLQGIFELTNVLQNIKSLESDAVKCFSQNPYSTGIERWSFNTTTHKLLFNELRRDGSSRFTLNIKNSCATCFNTRLLKLYIEFKGQEDQPESVPDTVHFMIRHLSASFFRDGDGHIQEYRQPLSSFRKMKFRRFAISDVKKCREEEIKGNRNSIYCVYRNDDRLQLMCNHPTSQGACTDSLLGEEECRSPYGTYEIIIPVDNNLSCDHPGMTDENCRDLQLSRFNTMNVWALFYYWPDVYPNGPDHQLCQQHIE